MNHRRRDHSARQTESTSGPPWRYSGHLTAVTPTAAGSVVCAPSEVPDGESTTCTATPNEGYYFLG
ncbi:InlB B-repeat-containing protein [Thiorhodovibrio winogradskyi]|uniref:InlB B-repeat-containing protein n=1 Tax=Thiorhodovibrio winogradskyi TaxID=77007 RepID=UPI0038B57533